MSTPDDLGEDLLRAALAPPESARLPEARRLDLAYAAGMAAGKNQVWKSALTLAVPALLVGLGLGWGLKTGNNPTPPDRILFYGREMPPKVPDAEPKSGVWMARSNPAVIEETSEKTAQGSDLPGSPWSVGYIRQHLNELGEGRQ